MSALLTSSTLRISPLWSGYREPHAKDPLFSRQRRRSSSQPTVVGRRGVVSALELPHVADMPTIILSVSPCRSGTTVMLRVMGAMGVESHFQPLKNVLRWRLEGRIQPWRLAGGARRTVYLKETLGPYTYAESTFNPLQLLLDAGVPPEKLHVLIYGRSPLNTWASWQKWWRNKTTLDYLLAAYRTTEQIHQQAIRANISMTRLVYEAFDQYSATAVIQKLAQRMKLDFTETAVANWETLPSFGSTASNIILPTEPARFITPHIHDHVHQARAFAFTPTSDSEIGTIDRYDQERIQRAKLFTLYDQWQQQCFTDLQLGEQTEIYDES